MEVGSEHKGNKKVILRHRILADELQSTLTTLELKGENEHNQRFQSISEALGHSDLVPLVYEGRGVSNTQISLDETNTIQTGGFKFWECASDLLAYLSEFGADYFQDKKVLEIGCGHGIPGIYILLCGAEVHFQDYVITLPLPPPRLHCYCGNNSIWCI